MTKNLLLLFCWIFACSVQAQKLTVVGMTLVDDDQSASTEKRLDAIGGPCALVKVKLPLEGASFGGNVITRVDYRDGEYWVYMTDGSYMLQVKHPQFQPLMVNFRDYGVQKVIPLKTYRISFPEQQQLQSQASTGTLQVSYTPGGSEVFLDGLRLGLSPVIQKGITPGSHKVVVKRQGCITMRKVVNIKAGEIIQLAGVLPRPEVKDTITAEGLTCWGYVLENGIGNPADIPLAIACYKRAANMGDTEAMTNLGWLYGVGKWSSHEGTFQYKNTKEAVKWFRMAADKGDPEGMRGLGVMYYRGSGVPKDFAEAAALFRQAGELNNAIAQRSYGEMLQNGEGVKKDKEAAVEWFRKAADQDDGNAQYQLGNCYENGLGVKKDKQKALEWYKKGAENHDDEASRALRRLK